MINPKCGSDSIMQKLDPITHPLNSVSLIEASAGTGKTYTIVALYLRLLLNAGENGLSRALSVDEILVMTFTEAATAELKERIRGRIVEVKTLFSEVLNQQLAKPNSDDPFIQALFDAVKTDLPSAVLRLDMAQQNMDTAAIFTIHGFCYRMLMRYAFDSGVHFNLELEAENDELLLQFCREYWREQYYPQNLEISAFIQQTLKSPQAVLARIKTDLSGEMPQVRSGAVQGDLTDFFQQQLMPYFAEIAELKSAWLAQQADIQALILAEIQRKKDKRIDGRTYQERHIMPAIQAINQWAHSSDNLLHPKLVQYFSQQILDQKTKGDDKITHPLFGTVDRLQASFAYPSILLWHYIQGVRSKISAYKATHKKVDFGDLLSRLKTALYAENGASLAQLIRQQFPFAMIDEFQDTDLEQYQIFKRLYLDQPSGGDSGMIIIGDPKQSIYAFRNADLFTYLTAAENAQQRYTLDTNWRSTPELVSAVNRIFSGAEQPFIYQQIQFQSVNAGKKSVQIQLNQQPQKPLNILLSADKNDDMAAACALSVQQWLKEAEQGKLHFSEPDISLNAKDFAVLVRTRKEAEKVKQALAALGIQSVYLSDRSSVLDSEWAQVMCYLLQACLHPQQESALMKVLASRLFHFNAQQLFQLRRNEQAWEGWIRDFVQYQRIWQTQGVLPMIHRLLQQQRQIATLLAMPDGERAITDLLHLAELLQQGAAINENEHALLSWFEQQMRSGETESDEVRLRLESERNLVKIVTIHKSKGLEYGVIWLPFLGAAFEDKSSKKIQRYHGDDNQLYYDLSGEHAAKGLTEKKAEELRLLYVALTRARYQLNLGLPAEFEQSRWNALVYLLADKSPPTEKKNATQSILPLLQQRLHEADYSITPLAELKPDDWRAQQPPQPELQAATFQRRIENNWRVSSFTALAAMQQRNQNRSRHEPAESQQSSYQDSAYDYDVENAEYRLLSQQAAVLPQLNRWQGQTCTPFNFPQGAKVGSALHDVLQYSDFQVCGDQVRLQALCQQLDLHGDVWLEPLQQWFEQIYQTPFTVEQPHLRLVNLASLDVLKELAFVISINRPLSMSALNRLLQQSHPLAATQPPLQLDQIQGMLRGFIDLVCRMDGKYYLLDYKSNFLGEGYQAYSPEILREVVAYHRYDLQYLIYTLALHRYLKQRDPHYDYQRDFGGVYYLFLRGMDGESSQNGVYFDKPDWRLIDGLDNLLADF